MSKAHVKRTDHGDGSDFINSQRTVDEAKNERMKSERDEDKLDPEQANRPANRSETSDTVSKKKTGSGNSKSLGD
jgi:hypothetical protein